ncbi:apiosidase-like domain-containing protein [Janibacter terrae]|uniref:apiosidase-like domain-containing protein n=1 Tax=Janibacter terrae TaxID=103817 RepID=UPI00146C99CD|nr:DUF4038 domain-containing protein [Janibacter terrae]
MGRRVLAVTALAVVLALGMWTVGVVRGDDSREVTAGPVPSELSMRPEPAEPAEPSKPPVREYVPLVTAVAPSGRYFVDQHGRPLLVRGDSPWSLMTDLSADQARRYFADRQSRGVNAMIVSVLGSVGNGGPSDDGATHDGVRPFRDGGITDWNPAYWRRMHAYVRMAQQHGITLVLYPVDSWVVDSGLVPTELGACRAYGRKVGEFFADLPNIMWSVGGDYLPDRASESGTEVDRCLDAVLDGIRRSGDTRPRTIQVSGGQPMASSDDPFWRHRISFNFAYTYSPTYRLVRRARAADPARPVVFGEGNYERENLQGNQPTTPETLRRQTAWALTSGAVADFYGSDDWEFRSGWQDRLHAPGLADVGHVRDVVEGLPWWTWEPDTEGDFITSGRGQAITEDDGTTDVLDSDLATAALAPDGSSGLVYVPTARTFTIDDSRLAGSVRAAWVDPSTGSRRSVPVRATYRTPGANADGDGDWLLELTSR